MMSSRPSRQRRATVRRVLVPVLLAAALLGSSAAAASATTTAAQSAPAAAVMPALVRTVDASPLADDTNGSVDTSEDGTSQTGKVGDDKNKGKGNAGSVTFGVRPANAKNTDLRTSWTYQNVKPGQSFVDYVGFVNLGQGPVTLSVYAADGQNTATGGFGVVPSKTASTDLGTWVTLAKKDVTVPAGKTVLMPFQVKVPTGAEPGDHAGGIVASFRTQAKDAKGNVVNVDNRVGTRMYMRVNGPLKPRISIDQVTCDFKGSGFGGAAADVTFRVKNEGNVRLTGHQALRITDLLGGTVLGKDVPSLPELLPKNSFTFKVRAEGLKPLSYFTANLTVDPQSITGNVDPALEQASYTTSFFGFSWPVLVVALGAALTVGFVGFTRLRRRRNGDDGSDTPHAPGPGSSGSPASATRRAPTKRAPAGVARRVAAAGSAFLLGGLVFTVGGVALAGPASADATNVTFLPAKGMDTTPMYAVLPAACPAQAPNVVGMLTGKNIPADGLAVIPNGSAGVRHDMAFGLPLQNTLKGFAAVAGGITYDGPYTLTVRCIDRLARTTFATFTGTITFSDPTHYTAALPSDPPASGVPLAVLGESFPQIASELSAQAAANPPSVVEDVAPQSPAVGQPQAQGQGTGPSAAAQPQADAAPGALGPSASGSGVSVAGVFAPLMVLVVVVAAAALVWQRNRPAAGGRPSGTTHSTAPSVTWPDESDR